MKSGEPNTDSYQGTMEGFLDGRPSGLGLVVKRVSLAGNGGRAPRMEMLPSPVFWPGEFHELCTA